MRSNLKFIFIGCFIFLISLHDSKVRSGTKNSGFSFTLSANQVGSNDSTPMQNRLKPGAHSWEHEFSRAHSPLPPLEACRISWGPNALTPVFYGVRYYDTTVGAPVPLRVFFPSLEGSVDSAPILKKCGLYPLILFAHGHCRYDEADHYRKWFTLPLQLARSGYVVVVPQLPSIASHPSMEDHPAIAALMNVLDWMRTEWEHRDVLMPAPATGIVGHSYGALLSARFAAISEISAFVSLSGVWQDWPTGLLPIEELRIPMFFIWGGPEDLFTALPDTFWNKLALPKHRAIFKNGLHWDYLPEGTPCTEIRGPCPHLSNAAADLVTMFFSKYLPPELTPDLPNRIPDNLFPPSLLCTTLEQVFYCGSHLQGMEAISGNPDCQVLLESLTSDDRFVPYVRFSPKSVAARDVREADLIPVFTGEDVRGAWVSSQSPGPGAQVKVGDVVRMQLRSGPIP